MCLEEKSAMSVWSMAEITRLGVDLAAGQCVAEAGRSFCAERVAEVLPYGGSLVLFRSRDLEHEVLPPKKNRYAMTMWYVEKGVVRSFEVRLDTEMLGLSLCGLAACEHEKSGCTAQKAIVTKVAEQSLFDQKTSHRMNDGSCQQRSLEAVTHI